MTTCSGHPAGDIARLMLMMNSPYITSPMPFFKKQIVKVLLNKYNKNFLETYIKLVDFNEGIIEKFILPVAAVRLEEKFEYEKPWLLNIVSQRIKQIDNN